MAWAWTPTTNSGLVVDMTAEHMERKRASDRINQRYSRARQKNRVAELENRNRALVSQLEDTEKRFLELKRSHEKLKAAVDAARILLQPESSPETSSPTLPGLRACASTSASDSITETTETLKDTNSENADTIPTIQALDVDGPSSCTRSLPESGSSELALIDVCQHDIPLEFGTGFTVNLMNEPSSISSYPSALLPWPASEGFVHDSSVSWAASLDAAAHAAFKIDPTLISTLSPPCFESSPIWRSLPLHLPPSTSIEQVFIEICESGRRWKSQKGEHYVELSERNFPSVASLLISSTEHIAAHPISAAVGKHATWGTSVIEFPSRVAYHYMVAHLLRWLVCQTEESYNQLPEFLRPTELQRSTPHPAWVDIFPWTEERDLIIQHMDFSKFESFRRITSNFSINWPYTDADMFLTDPYKNSIVLNPIFECHVRELKNWTFSPALAEEFPFLKSSLMISETVPRLRSV